VLALSVTAYILNTSKQITEMKKMKTVTTSGLVREVKIEDGKYYAWNEFRRNWYRIAKTKVRFV